MTKQAMTLPQGLDASGMRAAIIGALYNSEIVDALCNSAAATLHRYGVSDDNVRIVRVPGAYEIPLMAQSLADSNDALIVLGCVIRGETEHFEQVVQACSSGVQRVMLDCKIPIGFGVLAVNSIEQARERIQGELDRGKEAAEAALMMAQLLRAVE